MKSSYNYYGAPCTKLMSYSHTSIHRWKHLKHKFGPISVKNDFQLTVFQEIKIVTFSQVSWYVTKPHVPLCLRQTWFVLKSWLPRIILFHFFVSNYKIHTYGAQVDSFLFSNGSQGLKGSNEAYLVFTCKEMWNEKISKILEK